MWTGDLPASRVLNRIPGLMTEPRSRMRAKYLEMNPPPAQAGQADDTPIGHLGWSIDTRLLALMCNLTISSFAKEDETPALIPLPGDMPGAARKQPQTIDEFIKEARGWGLHVDNG